MLWTLNHLLDHVTQKLKWLVALMGILMNAFSTQKAIVFNESRATDCLYTKKEPSPLGVKSLGGLKI